MRKRISSLWPGRRECSRSRREKCAARRETPDRRRRRESAARPGPRRTPPRSRCAQQPLIPPVDLGQLGRFLHHANGRVYRRGACARGIELLFQPFEPFFQIAKILERSQHFGQIEQPPLAIVGDDRIEIGHAHAHAKPLGQLGQGISLVAMDPRGAQIDRRRRPKRDWSTPGRRCDRGLRSPRRRGPRPSTRRAAPKPAAPAPITSTSAPRPRRQQTRHAKGLARP